MAKKKITKHQEKVNEMVKKNEEQESGLKAFRLVTVCRFILCRTPMVLGYGAHQQMTEQIQTYINELQKEYKLTSEDTLKITECEEWDHIKKLLKI